MKAVWIVNLLWLATTAGIVTGGVLSHLIR